MADMSMKKLMEIREAAINLVTLKAANKNAFTVAFIDAVERLRKVCDINDGFQIPIKPDRALSVSWIDPEIKPPPKVVKLQILTKGGIAIHGHWHDDDIAWAPLLTVPKWARDRMRGS